MFKWKYRGRGLRSLLEYFLIDIKFRKQVVDVKVVRGAENESDRYLVLLKFQGGDKGFTFE